MTTIDILLLALLVAAAVWTVMTVRLLLSVIGLALVSALVSLLMFRLNAPYAAVIELSVCAGLISVIFFVAVSFTKRLTDEDLKQLRRKRLKKTLWLPFLLAGLGLILLKSLAAPVIDMPAAASGDVRPMLWGFRHLDLFGQILVLLAGAFGVVTLFKDGKK
jgi:NADH-quinone oxidoreductase subunit J